MDRVFNWLMLAVMLAVPAIIGCKSVPSAPSQRGGTVITRGDRLLIWVAGYQGLGRQYVVPSSGTVEFPPLGELAVAGLTTNELAIQVQRALLKVYRQASVTVLTQWEGLMVIDCDSLHDCDSFHSVAWRPGLTVRDVVTEAHLTGRRYIYIIRDNKRRYGAYCFCDDQPNPPNNCLNERLERNELLYFPCPVIE